MCVPGVVFKNTIGPSYNPAPAHYMMKPCRGEGLDQLFSAVLGGAGRADWGGGPTGLRVRMLPAPNQSRFHLREEGLLSFAAAGIG